MKTLHLVDGSGYIFRAYYAIHPLSNSSGLPTNALLGFTKMLIKLIRDEEAEHIAVMFDTSGPTFRHEMYSEYKANRSECPEDLVPQMPYFRKIVEALGIQSFEKPGFEADDIIATLTKCFSEQEISVVIVSGDKDLTQLVDERVQMWDAMRDIRFTPSRVQEKFGVLPQQMGDYLALVGDSSDNIPGLKGVGPKSAQKLIEAFGSVDDMLEAPEKIENIQGLRGSKKLREKVECGGEQIRLSQQLVRLDSLVAPFSAYTSLEEFFWHGANPDLVVDVFEELEFSKIVESIPRIAGDGVTNGIATGSVADNAVLSGKDYSILSPSELESFAKQLSSLSSFAFDTETTSVEVLDCELVGISISWESGRGFYCPVKSETDPDAVISLEDIRKYLGPVFADENVAKIGQNLKYDIGVLEEHGIPVRGELFDSMLASYVLSPETRQHGLKHLAKVHLNEQMLTYKEMVEDKDAIEEVPLERVAHYACHDADATWQLWQLFSEKLGERAFGEQGGEGRSQRRVFQDVEMPLVPVLSRMERTGIKLDVDFFESCSAELTSECGGLEKRVHELAGEEFNVNSPKQLNEILFSKLGLPTKGVKKTKSGYSTDASVLSKFAGEYEIARCLLEYRELFKLKSTYVDALSSLVRPDTNRVHTSFNQAIAATGRLSSSDPNLQNIPIRTERGRALRKGFVAEDGFFLISADYSQIELRVLAHLSEDDSLIRAFKDGEDIHSATARELFGSLAFSEDEQKRLRRVAKTINFGIIYGMGAFRLSRELGISRSQAQNYIDDYFSRYPKVGKFFDDLSKEIETVGFVETILGRRRSREAIETAGRDPGYAERSLINAPLQGSAAEIIKLAMIRLDARLEEFGSRARLALQVHDELVVEVEEELAEEVSSLIVSEMEGAMSLLVPISVDIRVGKTWGG